MCSIHRLKLQTLTSWLVVILDSIWCEVFLIGWWWRLWRETVSFHH